MKDHLKRMYPNEQLRPVYEYDDGIIVVLISIDSYTTKEEGRRMADKARASILKSLTKNI